MKTLPQNCLNCKYYRLQTADSGLCRVDKTNKPYYPQTTNNSACDKWYDCGQNYFIRVGWIKGQPSEVC